MFTSTIIATIITLLCLVSLFVISWELNKQNKRLRSKVWMLENNYEIVASDNKELYSKNLNLLGASVACIFYIIKNRQK